MNQVDVSVVIVNWNTKALLAQCLQSVNEHLLSDSSLHSEVIVVDNNSDDGSQDMVRNAYPDAKLICNEVNVGFARASNQAIAASRGNYVLLLNSDAQIVPGAVQQMAKALDQVDTIGIAGVCLVFPNGEPQFCYGKFPTLRTEFRSLFGMHRWDLSQWNTLERPHRVDWVSGACLMTRRELIDTVGPLDERFFFSGEEVDLCLRSTQAGWRVVVVPSTPVIHARAGSTGKTSERYLRLFKGKTQYAEKHWATLNVSVLRAMILVSSLGKLIFYGLMSIMKPRFCPTRQLWAEVVREYCSQRPA